MHRLSAASASVPTYYRAIKNEIAPEKKFRLVVKYSLSSEHKLK